MGGDTGQSRGTRGLSVPDRAGPGSPEPQARRLRLRQGRSPPPPPTHLRRQVTRRWGRGGLGSCGRTWGLGPGPAGQSVPRGRPGRPREPPAGAARPRGLAAADSPAPPPVSTLRPLRADPGATATRAADPQAGPGQVRPWRAASAPPPGPGVQQGARGRRRGEGGPRRGRAGPGCVGDAGGRGVGGADTAAGAPAPPSAPPPPRPPDPGDPGRGARRLPGAVRPPPPVWAPRRQPVPWPGPGVGAAFAPL